MTERKQAKAIRESIVLLCIGIRAQNMGFLCVSVPIFFALFRVSAITWAQTDYGSVRVVNTAFGKGVMAWTNFEAPAGKKLGSYGGLKFLTSAERRMESDPHCCAKLLIAR